MFWHRDDHMLAWENAVPEVPETLQQTEVGYFLTTLHMRPSRQSRKLCRQIMAKYGKTTPIQGALAYSRQETQHSLSKCLSIEHMASICQVY